MSTSPETSTPTANRDTATGGQPSLIDPLDDAAPFSGAESVAGASDPNLEVLDYLHPEYRKFALQELSHVKSIGYFLPLLHELFNGGEARTRILFTILQKLMTDDRVRWTRQDLDEKFHWLKDGHRGYFLYRLSNVGWLEFLRDQSVYMVSDKGEALMRLMSRFTMGPELVHSEGAALAEIEFSILLEVDDLTDRLKFLRNRLMKHALRAEQALKSESAYKILEIYQQLQSAYRWAEQTRRTLDHLEIEDDNIDQWNAVRAVHDHLSHLHQLISRMQLVLQDIQRKQIDIARFGLTHLDFDNYLINNSIDTLADTMKHHLRKIPHPFFMIETNAFAEAAHVMGRLPADGEAVRGWETTVTDAAPHGVRLAAVEAEEFVHALATAPREWGGIEKLMDEMPWEIAAYRFSLLTMLADREARSHLHGHDANDPFINVAAEAEFDALGTMIEVPHGEEMWTMTRGRLRSVPVNRPPTATFAEPDAAVAAGSGATANPAPDASRTRSRKKARPAPPADEEAE